LDHEAGVLSCVDTYHLPGINVSAFVAMTRQMTFAKGAGLPGRVWADGKSLFVADVSRNNSFPRAAVAARCDLHCAFAIPIRCDGSFVGVVEFFSRRVQEPAEEIRQMLEACGSQVGQYIERKLGENELRKAKEEAERAARSKADVLAIMSHEIRTPLNAVIGMTGLLLETSLNRTQSDYAETIRISSETLLSVINDILDFSKIESEKLRLEEHPLEINSCVEDVLDLVARQALEKNIDLVYVIEPDVPPWISGDITRLRQILLNLASNALKFTERGEIVVSVRKRAERGTMVDLEFMVKDTGIGIPRARLDRLFKPFSQVDTSTTRKYGGTGLGLAICSRLVEMMGGTISVETQEGKGSTFSFVIPVRLATGLPRLYHRANIPELAGRRVLVVDDSETNRRILIAQLQQWGMVAVPASSGRDALRMVADNASFDLAILDMQMPEMDGVHLARELRKHSAWKAARMVLLTSLGKNEEVLQSEPGLFDACATRPVRKSVLYNMLVEAFGGVPTAIVTDRLRPPEANLGERYPLRILVAEDNPTNQKLMLLTLEHLGYRPDVAADGLEVLAALRRQQYDLVFMDVEMPEMDGLETTRHIAEEWPLAERPIIVGATAYAMEGDAEKIREAGMDGYITKPIRLEEILHCLKRWGAARRMPPSVAGTTALESVDAKRIAEIRGIAERNAPEIFVQLIDLYQEDYEELVKRMRNAVRERNPADVAKAAHRLKGTSLNLGVTPVAETCVRIESLIANNELASVSLLLDHLDEVYGPVRQHLDAIKRSAHETVQR
jgi:signal transduction histidine kinase/DNA-binding response OmpR family regulator